MSIWSKAHNLLTLISGWTPSVWPIKWKLLSSTFMWCCLHLNILKLMECFYLFIYIIFYFIYIFLFFHSWELWLTFSFVTSRWSSSLAGRSSLYQLPVEIIAFIIYPFAHSFIKCAVSWFKKITIKNFVKRNDSIYAKLGEFKLSLSFRLKLSCVLRYSHRLSCTLIEFEPAQIFLESRQEFSLVWPTLDDSQWDLKKTLILVCPGLNS